MPDIRTFQLQRVSQRLLSSVGKRQQFRQIVGSLDTQAEHTMEIAWPQLVQAGKPRYPSKRRLPWHEFGAIADKPACIAVHVLSPCRAASKLAYAET
jgi:hypothetical protein